MAERRGGARGGASPAGRRRADGSRGDGRLRGGGHGTHRSGRSSSRSAPARGGSRGHRAAPDCRPRSAGGGKRARARDAARARSQQLAADLARERALAADAAASLDRLAAERARFVELRAGEASTLAAAREALAEAGSAVADCEARTLARTERVAAERAGRAALQANRDEAVGHMRRLAARREEAMRQQRAGLAEAESLTDAAAAEAGLASCEGAVAAASSA